MKSDPKLKEALFLSSRGDCQGLRKLIRTDADLIADARLLNAAALYGQAETVTLLLEVGADPDGQVPSHEYYRPLHRAIEHRGFPKSPGHRRVVEILLQKGASLEKRATWMQLVPLAVAGMAGDTEIISLLIENGAEGDIFTAAVTADAKKVRAFLKRKNLAASKDSNNLTVLHYAALSGLSGEKAERDQRQIAEMLLDAGADGNAREDIGPYPATPVLHFAAWKNYATAEVLLNRGCDPNHGFGNCLWREPGRMADLFLAHGADVNGREPSGQPLLNSRIHWNLSSVALWLLKNGANPNLADKDGNTPLHEAAARGINVKVVQAILDCGGTKKAKNQDGLTALAVAQAKGREKIALLLTQAR